ncbi:hypothetical protein EDB85DRAFT_2241827 [Lactarius pseudohatsudake]|nr:hypothetical protein EDB85DRAFT_2241827 [Lactarius pseudohatsudake]
MFLLLGWAPGGATGTVGEGEPRRAYPIRKRPPFTGDDSEAGRPKSVAFAPQSPAPSPPGPPSQEATTGARTAVASPSPLTKGARTDTVSAAPSPPSAPSPPAPKPKGKGKATGASTAPVALPLQRVQVTKQQTSRQQASSAAAAQQRTPAGRLKPGASPTPRNTTRVVVSRNGGFPDKEKETLLRASIPGLIATSVRTAIERSTPAPIHILSAQWAKGVETTGNFVYSISGKIPMERILQFSKFLLQPFPGGTLLPAEGWCWAQLRDVRLRDDDGHIFSEDTLMTELIHNPVFQGIPFVTKPHWLNDITKIETDTSTVVFAYIDTTGKVAAQAMKEGVYMFNFGVKFVFAGDSPRPKQCGRCFEMGHLTNAPGCKWNGKNRCVRCYKAHHHDDHNMHCTATHAAADRCDCKFPCLLCGKTGHNARSRTCSVRGDFPPPRAVKCIVDEGADIPPPPPPKSILKRPTEMPTPSPPSFTPARVDDDDAPLFDPTTLDEEAAPAPTQPTPTSAPPQPAPSKPKARIVLPHTDTAKPDETSTERAATRHSSTTSAPSEPQSEPSASGSAKTLEEIKAEFPALPLRSATTPDHLTLARIEDRMHQIMLEATTGIAVVRVGKLWYRCPSNELNINFRKLRDRETMILIKMRNGETLGPDDKFNFLAKYEREARKSRAFGSFDLMGNPTNEKLTPSAILTSTTPVLPL